jgi:hypothetical protein
MGLRDLFRGNKGPAGPGLGQERMKELCQRFVGSLTVDEKQVFLEQHQEMLSLEVDAYLAGLASRQKTGGARDMFEQVRKLLLRCREVGIDDAFSEYRKSLPSAAPENKLVPVVHAFITAGSLEKMRWVVEAHPELLTPEVDALLAKTADDRTRRAMLPYRYLLTRCSEVGIARAFSEAQADA